jgi:hypothetical protein
MRNPVIFFIGARLERCLHETGKRFSHHAFLDYVRVSRPFRDGVELYDLLLPGNHEISELAFSGAVRHARKSEMEGMVLIT